MVQSSSNKSTLVVNLLRDTVMHLMRALDPEGVEQRKSRRLKRRLYNCKVQYIFLVSV